jgi:hypothetical protein
VKAAPKFLQGLQQLLYPSAGISATVRAPGSSSGNASSGSSGYEGAAKTVEAEMRIGSIFRRRLTQLARADDKAIEPKLEGEDSSAGKPLTSGATVEGEQEVRQVRERQGEGNVQQSAEAAASSAAASSGGSSSSSAQLPLLSMCLNLNASLCSTSVSLSNANKGGFLLVVYNPLSRSYDWGVRIPVEEGQYAVAGPDGKAMLSQVLPLPDGVQLVWPNSQAALGAKNKPTAELAVMVSAPLLGHAVYKVVWLPDAADVINSVTNTAAGANTFAVVKWRSLQEASADSEVVQLFKKGSNNSSTQHPMILSNGKLQMTVGSTGISSVTIDSRIMNFSAALIKYQNRFAGSGAYVFKARGTPHAPVPNEVIAIRGPLVQEIRQRFRDVPGVLTTRLWAGESHLEIDWTAGPAGRVDWEVFLRYNTSINSRVCGLRTRMVGSTSSGGGSIGRLSAFLQAASSLQETFTQSQLERTCATMSQQCRWQFTVHRALCHWWMARWMCFCTELPRVMMAKGCGSL